MSITAPRDTLAYQIYGRPLTTKRHLRNFPAAQVMECINELIKQNPNITGERPETSAIMFYMLNHAVAEVRRKFYQYQPLGPMQEILELYHRYGSSMAVRMAYYLLLICARESRHVKNADMLRQKIVKQFGQAAYEHLRLTPDSADTAVMYLRDNPPKCTIGQYCEMMEWVFVYGKWPTHYGGPRWGEIARTLNRLLSGEFTPEMMLDTAYTLAHNGGPIFNKGMLFAAYEGAALRMVLDVQRAGMIPQLVANEEIHKKYLTSTVQDAFATCSALLGPEWSAPGYVDWFKVESLGALGNYTQQKHSQAHAHGIPPWHSDFLAQQKKKQEIAAQEQKAKIEADKAKAAEEAKLWVEMVPAIGHEPPIKVKKINRAKAA
jgi:hypothetical protein